MAEETRNKRVIAKARTRQRVLDACRKLFEARGYEAATIRDIAKEAGMSTGAFFASFREKETVYAEIYGHPPISAEDGKRLMEVVRGFSLNRASIALSDQAHPGARGAMDRLLDLADDLTHELAPKEEAQA